MTLTVPAWLGRSISAVNRVPALNRVIRVERAPRKIDKEYWRNSYDAKVPYGMTMKLRWPVSGTLLNYQYQKALGEIYLKRDNGAFFAGLDAMIAAGHVPPITRHSHVLEPGCNVGAVLRQLHTRYGCAVTGIDISKDAVTYAQNHVFRDDPKAKFRAGDVLDPTTFEGMQDQQFSHVICVSHLVHVPNGPEKSAYIERLKRLGRSVVFYERIATENDPRVQTRHMEDYAADYGFTLFRADRKPHPTYQKRIGFFFYENPSATDERAARG